MKIMIDAGHGGTESGAVANGVLEKDLNLEVALCLKNILSKYDIEVELTRYQDSNVSLKERCEISNLFKADLFISIHHNAANGKAKGYEVYHYRNSKKGAKIANIIGKYFDKLNSKRYIGGKPMGGSADWDYYILKNTKAIAVLTEFCFIDNLDDLKKYDPHKQAEAISKAILEYFNIEENNNEEKTKEHWAEEIYKELTENFGLTIHEKCFNDKITRAESMALLLQGLKSIKKYIDSIIKS